MSKLQFNDFQLPHFYLRQCFFQYLVIPICEATLSSFAFLIFSTTVRAMKMKYVLEGAAFQISLLQLIVERIKSVGGREGELSFHRISIKKIKLKLTKGR